MLACSVRHEKSEGIKKRAEVGRGKGKTPMVCTRPWIRAWLVESGVEAKLCHLCMNSLRIMYRSSTPLQDHSTINALAYFPYVNFSSRQSDYDLGPWASARKIVVCECCATCFVHLLAGSLRFLF